jgi:hypothetical protein
MGMGETETEEGYKRQQSEILRSLATYIKLHEKKMKTYEKFEVDNTGLIGEIANLIQAEIGRPCVKIGRRGHYGIINLKSEA